MGAERSTPRPSGRTTTPARSAPRLSRPPATRRPPDETPADHEAPGWYVPEIDDRIVLSASTDSTDGYMPVASPMPDDFDASGPVGVEVEGLDDLNL
jgi:hypothetical protein